MSEHYDVIIIGSGAGGGTLAHRLAPSGKKVLILERGDWLPREVENWDATAVFVDNRYVSPDTWYDKDGKSFQPQIHYNVGGATKLYGAALYRLRPGDFGELHHFDGISPAWPLSYDDFEPYYTQAEQLYQVHGNGGEDPDRGPAQRRLPVPSGLERTAHPAVVRRPAASRNAPVPRPCGILLDEANPAYSSCIRCATCDGFPCMIHAKSDAEVIAVRPAIDYPNVTLLRNTRVTRLHTDDTGRSVTGVVAVVDNTEQHFHGDIVVVSAGAANSAKLLLNSATHLHPAGFANGSDQVGRNYLFHNSLAFLAVFTEKNPTRFQKTLSVNDFYFGDAEYPYPMGNIQMVGKSSAPMYRGEKPLETLLAPNFALSDVAVHAVDFWLSTEDLPRPTTSRITGMGASTPRPSIRGFSTLSSPPARNSNTV